MSSKWVVALHLACVIGLVFGLAFCIYFQLNDTFSRYFGDKGRAAPTYNILAFLPEFKLAHKETKDNNSYQLLNILLEHVESTEDNPLFENPFNLPKDSSDHVISTENNIFRPANVTGIFCDVNETATKEAEGNSQDLIISLEQKKLNVVNGEQKTQTLSSVDLMTFGLNYEKGFQVTMTTKTMMTTAEPIIFGYQVFDTTEKSGIDYKMMSTSERIARREPQYSHNMDVIRNRRFGFQMQGKSAEDYGMGRVGEDSNLKGHQKIKISPHLEKILKRIKEKKILKMRRIFHMLHKILAHIHSMFKHKIQTTPFCPY